MSSRLTLEPGDEELSDAFVMAAASELLEALEESIKQVEWWQSNHGCCAGVSDEWFAKARAAISKARGEA